MIVDLSHPPNHSVNGDIAKESSSMSYASIDDAVNWYPPPGFWDGADKNWLKDAYRIVPIRPQDHLLLAITWEGRTYVDHALPFGLRSPLKIISIGSGQHMLAWALDCSGIQHQIYSLDDFLLVLALNSDKGAHVLAVAIRVFEHLGEQVAVHIIEGPSTTVTFPGIVIEFIFTGIASFFQQGSAPPITNTWMD